MAPRTLVLAHRLVNLQRCSPAVGSVGGSSNLNSLRRVSLRASLPPGASTWAEGSLEAARSTGETSEAPNSATSQLKPESIHRKLGRVLRILGSSPIR